MREKKPKGIEVKFFKESEFRYYLCPNCYEYLLLDECPECGLICEIKDSEKIDLITKEDFDVKDFSKFFENLLKI